MSQQPVVPMVAGSEPPRSFVLGYITGESGTRVKGVAGAAMLIQGILYLSAAVILGVVVFGMTANRSEWADWTYIFGGSAPSVGLGWRIYSPYSTSGGPPRWDVFCYLMDLLFFETPMIPALIAFVTGLFSVIFAGGVKRGKRSACLVSMVPVAVTMIVCVVTAVSTGAIAAIRTFHLFSVARMDEPELIFWISTILAALVACLCIDLMGYLRWIARQMMGEKPAKKFI